MILVIDVGNTNLHLGLFTMNRLRATWRLSTDPRRTADEYAFLIHGVLGDDISIDGCLISSVVPTINATLMQAIEKAYHVEPMLHEATTEMGVINGYERPAEVGMDRLANAVGGVYFYGPPLLILDFGTAVTLDYVASPDPPGSKPIYKGGAILPGLRLAAESLYTGTSKLPIVDLAEPRSAIGGTTVNSIRAGLFFGFQGAISALVERAREEIGSACRVVATGGDASWFRNRLNFPLEVQTDLTLFGLRQIYGINNGCPLPKPE